MNEWMDEKMQVCILHSPRLADASPLSCLLRLGSRAAEPSAPAPKEDIPTAARGQGGALHSTHGPDDAPGVELPKAAARGRVPEVHVAVVVAAGHGAGAQPAEGEDGVAAVCLEAPRAGAA